VATLLLLFCRPTNASETGLLGVLFKTAVVNVVLNLMVTETRSVFPFTMALLLIATLWLGLRKGLLTKVLGGRQGSNSRFASVRRNDLEETRPRDDLHNLGKQRLADVNDR